MIFFTAFLSFFILTATWAANPVPKISETEITVSGVSSGAFMAQQLHVAYSDIFSGMGSVAGGPFFVRRICRLVTLQPSNSSV